MDPSSFTRVKLKFRDNIKVGRLDSTVDESLQSIPNLKKFVFKHFPEIEEMVKPSSRNHTGPPTPQHSLVVKCADNVGDYVTLESESDLEVAMASRSRDLNFVLDVKTASPMFNDGRRAGGETSTGPPLTRKNRPRDYDVQKQRRPQQALCRHFERGHCKNGPTCRFSHEIESSSNRVLTQRSRSNLSRAKFPKNVSMGMEFSENNDPSFFRRTVDSWLTNQLTLAGADNIEQLSSKNGLDMLSKVVEERNLPNETISRFVKVLVKDDIRSSLLRFQTNKIYGVLLGSPFLLQLHAHIASHLGFRTSKHEDVKPYLSLIEELQSRTENGWKEVPLDAVQNIVSKLAESTAKDELWATVSRLLDQRQELARLQAVAPLDKCLRGARFRQVPIVPGKEELLRLQSRQDLPINRIGMTYARVSDYLETHFQLLREDCIDPLRQGIKVYRSSNNSPSKKIRSNQELRIYSRVRLIGVRCGDNGIEYVISFHLPATKHHDTQWETSKRLMFGALLCISLDKFETFFWGTVARRDPKELGKGQVAIRVVGESEANVAAALQSGRTSAQDEPYVMVESTAAYFEAYVHVLKSLQREEMEDVPFSKYLLQLEPRVSTPSYFLRRKRGDEYDFTCAFPDIKKTMGRSSIRINQEWPSQWADSLDKAQQNALRQGLTKELAIIQGPPGTGKTYLGLLLVKILLANLKRSPGHDLKARANRRKLLEQEVLGYDEEESYDMSGPILVICYTNHALDQFLEGIYRDGECNLIRIGGRGKSETLKGRNLNSLLQDQRAAQEVEGSHRRLFGQGRSEKDSLEFSIHRCIDRMGSNIVTRQLLEGVATQDQIQSLFVTSELGCTTSKRILELWLREEWCTRNIACHIFFNESLHHPELAEDSDEAVLFDYQKPLRGHMKPLPTSTDDGEWTYVRERRGRGRRGTAQNLPDVQLEQLNNYVNLADEEVQLEPQLGAENEGNGGPDDLVNAAEFVDEEIPLQDLVDVPDVWNLTRMQRRQLHDYWLDEIRANCRRELSELSREYEKACRKVTEVENEIQLSLLRKAKVVGMTTTAAARYHEVLKSLKPEVIIVEEAAEVLEGHILACLNPSVKHLILIGDHLQLRPSVAVYRLATENKLDVSMFERLVRSGVEHVTLQEQRRMRPDISKLVRGLYPGSKDHNSVTKYDSVQGVSSDVFFFDHKAEENQSHDATSKVNITEAKLVVELCLYLLSQGYNKPKQISILSMYTGQLQEIKKLLRQRSSGRLCARSIEQIRDYHTADPSTVSEENDLLPRVSSVDDYQGEESDIIILSLVRSNSIVTDEGEGKIGFLKTPNRICVALTRAKMGLFIFGNADLLAERSRLWKEVTDSLRNDGALGPQLELYCQNHADVKTRISSAEDFKQVEDGGCSLPCDYQLDCGHACPRRCHPTAHDLVVCPKPCLRTHNGCAHICNRRCHGTDDCPPCEVIVTKQLPDCGHKQEMACRNDVKDAVCTTACPLLLECGHKCRKRCGRSCTESCEVEVVRTLACGHSAKIPCRSDPGSQTCAEPCGVLLPGCNHRCTGSCGRCKQGTAHIPCNQRCGRNLPCGHVCEAGCSLSCPPCRKKCRKKCLHSSCNRPCSDPCVPCLEPCAWQCQHYRCEKRCHEVCTRPRCDRPCTRRIPACKHPCIGLCGEPCPSKCRICHGKTMENIMLMTLDEFEESDMFLQLTDCRHVFEVTGLDTWMDSDETIQRSDGSVPIQPKQCPECRSLIWRTFRYSTVVKEKQAQLEEVKKIKFGHEQTRVGNLLLQQGDTSGALSNFTKALAQNPGLMDAHFGTGCAFFAEKNYAKSMAHLSYIVERSSFAAELAHPISTIRGNDSAAAVFDQFYGTSSNNKSRAKDSLTISAIVQWASAFTQRRNFTDAIALCDAVLRRDPANQLATDIKQKAGKGEVQLVMQAMEQDVGAGPGHWYTCPNGHYYTIGECGGAMQVSVCPDCKAAVGGSSHQLLANNTRLQM